MASDRPPKRGLRLRALTRRRLGVADNIPRGPTRSELNRLLATAASLPPSKRRRLIEAVRAALAEQENSAGVTAAPDSD